MHMQGGMVIKSSKFDALALLLLYCFLEWSIYFEADLGPNTLHSI